VILSGLTNITTIANSHQDSHQDCSYNHCNNCNISNITDENIVLRASLKTLSEDQGLTREQNLTLGQVIEKNLQDEQTDRYAVELAAPGFLALQVKQQGIDVVVQVIDPTGKVALEIDNVNGITGTERVYFVSAQAGRYQVIISRFAEGPRRGQYQLTVAALKTTVGAAEQQLGTAGNLMMQVRELLKAKKRVEAIQTWEKILQLQEAALGPEDLAVADSLNYLGNWYRIRGDYERAEKFLQRGLEIREKLLGPNHVEVATALNNLAVIYRIRGDYRRAETLYQRSLQIRETVLGADHSDVGVSLNNLALLYRATGDYDRAEPLFQRTLQIWERVFGIEDPDVGLVLNNLAILYAEKGDYDRAEPLLQRSLAIKEKAFGKDSLDLASALNNLGLLATDRGDYLAALPYYQRSLTIKEKVLGREHPDVATSIYNLAELARNQQKFDEAVTLYQRSLAMREKALGAEHPDVAVSLYGLAELYRQRRDFATALPLYQRGLVIRQRVLGNEHPLVVQYLHSLALLYEANGEMALAVHYRVQANEARERDLQKNLATGSESQKLKYLHLTDKETNATLALHLQSARRSPLAATTALTVLLQRKGRALDAMTDAISILRRRADAHDQQLLDNLAILRGQIAALSNRGPGPDGLVAQRVQLQSLAQQADALEAAISTRSAQIGRELQRQRLNITVAAVQQAIPENAALVEFTVYRPQDFTTGRYGAPHYAVYLLKSDGTVQFADLGRATQIDQAVMALRQALIKKPRQPLSSVSRTVKPRARLVDRLVMQPVRALVGGATHLLISPDSSLNLVPFDALVDQQGRYLVQRYEISYLTSGRDLLRVPSPVIPEAASALIFAAPDYGEGGGPLLLGKQLGRLRPLVGAITEGREIQQQFTEAALVTGTAANEAALRQAKTPLLLHIATHGYFLPDEPYQLQNQLQNQASAQSPNQLQPQLQNSPRGSALDRALVMDRQNVVFTVDELRRANPLLRSYLFFSGANNQVTADNRPNSANRANFANFAEAAHEAENDGVMTALEVAGLNLQGTKLVVLSACDTGLGEVRNGEGVYGLRRALVLAGAESQMISLWPISDQGTQELMVNYYQRLKQGVGRSVALRQVRLIMLNDPARRHPYYWASFIQSGEWGTLTQ
jgi:CHAT domain-containing protein